MRFPSSGPFLEFNFYWGDLSEVEALARLAEALLALGATFVKGGGLADVGEAQDGAMDGASGRPHEIAIASMEDLEQYLTEPHTQVERLYMEGATNTTRGVAEIITYTSVSDEARRHDHRPLAIWTEGVWTEAWQRDTREGRQRASAIGRRAKDRFCALVARTQPSYAAITVEDSLRTPYELRRAPYGHAFHDFYVSGSYIGPAALAALADLFAGAYVEPIADGLYVSCWEFLNPRGIGMTTELEHKKSAVARSIVARR